MKLAESRGAYPADRTSALSGVPVSTVHYWAREEILVPSISPSKIKLWSYSDLMALRTIYWLRQRKVTDVGPDIPPTTMPAVRRALRALRDLDLGLWTEENGPGVVVDPNGEIYLRTDDGPETVSGARPLDPDLFDLIAPFETPVARGPNLHRPRPHLRIVPGKLSGAPHIEHTRIETLAIASLRARGFGSDRIEKLYPDARPVALEEAFDLERQLNANLAQAA